MGPTFNETQILQLLQKTLPTYCKPDKIYFIHQKNYSKHHFMNSSGKIDKMKLQQFLHNHITLVLERILNDILRKIIKNGTDNNDFFAKIVLLFTKSYR